MRTAIRFVIVTVVTLFCLLLGPLSVLAFGELDNRDPWSSASRASAGLAPKPDAERRAVVQVYGARTLRWRGAFAIHTWIATKRRDAKQYTIHHVVGWRYYRGGQAVVTQTGTPDFKWFGAVPKILVDWRGPQARAMIDQIESAIDDYRYRDWYRVWPGPNSNTFTAFVARQVPALGLDLPPTAIGKDYLGGLNLIDSAPSGTGWQFSAFGLVGLTLARSEGIELSLLGLSIGLDLDDLALRLPGLGRVALWPGS